MQAIKFCRRPAAPRRIMAQGCIVGFPIFLLLTLGPQSWATFSSSDRVLREAGTDWSHSRYRKVGATLDVTDRRFAHDDDVHVERTWALQFGLPLDWGRFEMLEVPSDSSVDVTLGFGLWKKPADVEAMGAGTAITTPYFALPGQIFPLNLVVDAGTALITGVAVAASRCSLRRLAVRSPERYLLSAIALALAVAPLGAIGSVALPALLASGPQAIEEWRDGDVCFTRQQMGTSSMLTAAPWPGTRVEPAQIRAALLSVDDSCPTAALERLPAGDRVSAVRADRGGWPFSGFWGVAIDRRTASGDLTTRHTDHALEMKTCPRIEFARLWPVGIRPVHFALLVASWAAMALATLLLVPVPSFLAILARSFSGRCHVCGYPQRGHTRRCPECGTTSDGRADGSDVGG